MEKSADAFRTISEVAEQLDTPAHVLRFWESRFPQVRPVKRAGGRRYYRPADVALLTGIKKLLHDDGVTIRGVQKILREQGVRHVAALGGLPALPQPEADIEAVLAAEFGPVPEAPQPPVEAAKVQTAQVISLEAALARVEARPDQRAVQLPLDLPAVTEDVPEAPFVEAEEEPLPDPVPLRPAPPLAAGSLPQAGPQAGPEAPAEPADDEADEAPADTTHSTTAARLRQVTACDVADRREALLALRERMVNLRARLAKGVRRRAR